MRTLLIVALQAILCGVAAASVTKEEIADFVDESPSVEHLDKERAHLVQLLKSNLPKAGYDGAKQRLAEQWQISPTAADYALEAVLVSELSLVGTQGEEAVRHDRIAQSYLEALKLAPQSERLWSLAIEHLDYIDRCELRGLADLYFSNAASRYFLDPATGCVELVLSYARLHPMTPLAWSKVLGLVDEWGTPSALEIASAKMLAESTLALPQGHSADAHLYAWRLYFSTLAATTSAAQFIREVVALPADLRNTVLLRRPSGPVRLEGREIETEDSASETFEDFRAAWVLALLDAGQQADAQHWLERFDLPAAGRLARIKKDDWPRERVFEADGVDSAEFLRRVAYDRTDPDPFELFVGNGETGLLWGPAVHSTLAVRAAARFMTKAEYPEIANYLWKLACQQEDHGADEAAKWMARLDEFPRELRAAVQLVEAELTKARNSAQDCERLEVRVPADVGRRVYKEVPIPPELRRTGDDDAMPENTKAVADSQLPPAHFVRAEQRGDVIAGISLSQNVDPVGEVGGGGYWFHLSPDGGRTWKVPLYLGFQQFQPYVVPGGSRVPLLNERTLQLEVEIAELDEDSVSFPPVGLTTKREARDLYLEISLDDLERDTDHDELPDWLEEKLRTDPANRDSDADGIGDGYDDMPQISARSAPHALAPIVISVLREVAGYESSALTENPMKEGTSTEEWLATLEARLSQRRPPNYMFIQSDRTLFGGLTLPGNVVVLSDDDVAYLRARFGICYPLQFPAIWLDHSGSRAVVQWSASWVGGTLLFEKKEGKWISQVVQQWIT